ncbi:oxidoreductase [Shewanella algicola]|uniref:Aldo/keto reductase n=1 Tax=Shewanella algicola TaxID=640633 RepID=A0A9X1ZAH3_9GAMM|nr:aldo/keto reductase [Shewanella algicola]MCL1104855.1 aldo/keto reductase [Shewanella algicola]GGP57254.1 oxidoreductase [Shewanella algicola]
MTHLPLREFLPNVSSLVYGCMGLGGGWNANSINDADIKQAHQVIDAAIDNKINYFDQADIYTFGKAEQVFGKVLAERPALRQEMYLQSKCGIRFADDLGPKRYDLSAQWIQSSVDKSLAQLHTDYLDVLVLHRPDPLMQPTEIAQVFSQLKTAGKVRFLGVSNMQQHQVQALQQELDAPLVLNQVEMSLQKHDWLDETVYAGNQAGKDINFTPGMMQYCQQQRMQIQAWGSLCQGLYSGMDVSDQPIAVQQTSQLVQALAEQYHTTAEAILLSWLMQHPSQIQPVIGTTNLQRINACSQATQVSLSREHWYALYVSAKGQELP